METARCTQDDSIYSTNQFANLSREAFSEMRQNLICPACGGPAFFRRQTQNGRDPCFGARPHADWCSLRAAQTPVKSDSFDPASLIVVDFSYGAPEQPEQPGGGYNNLTPDESYQHMGFNKTVRRRMRLRPLLRLLTSQPDFPTSPQVLEINGIGAVRACDIFVPFKSISGMDQGRCLGVFGKIASAQYVEQDKTVWLNSGNVMEPSICVPAGIMSLLLDQFQISSVAYFTGASMLMFGTVHVSQNGKTYVLLDAPQYLMVDFLQL